MIEFKFKDVGQGDSILFKWLNQEGELKVGIIDCNTYQFKNPLLEEIMSIEDAFSIEFFILTHGHRDHYSGVLEVLEFCCKKNISITNFTSTLHSNQFQYFEITRTYESNSKLVKLVKFLDSLEEDGLIKNLYPAYSNIINFKMQETSNLECLHPKQLDYTKLGYEIDKYLKKGNKNAQKPNLNNVSTIFRLRTKGYYVLFTSDSSIIAQDTINRKYTELQTEQLLLIQIPHHGSIKNHSYRFLRSKNKKDKCPAVFSVGTNHNLPDLKVVEEVKDLDYEIYSTNYVNGIKEYIEGETNRDYSYVLDAFSSQKSSYSLKGKDRFRGDKSFSLCVDEVIVN